MGHAQNIVFDPSYNEVSSLTFELPAVVDGEAVPYYEQVVGMNVVDYQGVGQFILTNPVENNDGILCKKECKAYSLEYELTYKKFFVSKGTYNFWNPVAQKGTILGMILDLMPSWKPGRIDESLIGVYRTFELNGSENIYNVIKSKLQKTYNCIFEFDTYERTISVRDVSSYVKIDEVYLSLDNLVKNLEIEEQTENIITCLDVNGADGVDIRMVNPMGINKIYNLDYWMTPQYFSDEMIGKYFRWKQAFQDAQTPYYNLTIHKMLKTTQLLSEKARLVEIQGQLKAQENLQAVYIEALSEGVGTAADFEYKLNTVRTEIARLNGLIAAQKALVSSSEAAIADLTEQQQAINAETSLSYYFEDAELKILDHYIKEDAISESSFVYPTAQNYKADDQTWLMDSTQVSVLSNIQTLADEDGELFTARGGSIQFGTFGGDLVSATYERKTTGEFLLTAYLAEGRVTDADDGSVTAYKNACLTISGKSGGITNQTIEAGSYKQRAVFTITEAVAYFTVNLTEYDKFAVSWDLFNYGMECLEKFAYPSYKFNISVANFLSLDEYLVFQQQLRLGDRVYIDTEKGVLKPVCIGAHIENENPSALTMAFNDTFSANDPAFGLAELLEQSVSMGHTLDTERFSYSEYIASGADTSVKEYMDQALDLAKKDIMSTTGQGISMGSEGMRLRQKLADGTYHDEQTWIVNNKILFTDDNWQTVKGLVGKFEDPNLGSMYGLMMPYISGTILAGNNLIIESAKKDGDKSVFRVDGSGAALYNASFDLYQKYSSGGQTYGRHISLNPDVGIAIGGEGMYTEQNGQRTFHQDKAKFWADTQGNVHFSGDLTGATGTFTGALHVGAKDAYGNVTAFHVNEQGQLYMGASTFDAAPFKVDTNGKMTATGGAFTGTIDVGGTKTANGWTGGFHVDTYGNLQMGTPSYNQYGQLVYPFTVDSSGNLYANSANISGTITASDIDVNPTTAARLDSLLRNYSTFYGGNITDLDASHITTGTLSANVVEAISISADKITSGTLDAGAITLSNDYGGFMSGTGKADDGNGGTVTTEGAMIYGGPADFAFNYLIATTMGVRMQSEDKYFGIFKSGYSTNINGLGGSDRRLKHDIQLLDETADQLQKVYMALRPSTFAMNGDKRDQRTIGFIAQEVEDAFVSAGIDPTGYHIVRAPVSDDINRDNYMLYYNEFTAWNVYMIQKLYARVEELETELSLLKEKTNDN